MKIALIGTHGVGKTTLCYGLASRLKRRDVSLEVVHEIARRCPLPLNRETTAAAQSWILHTQVAEEVVAQSRYPVVITDRSVLDNYVYRLLAAGADEALEGLVDRWLATYELLVYVPIVEEPQPDGIRSPDRHFQLQVDELLREELGRRGCAFHRLDPARRPHWLGDLEELVASRLDALQLPLFDVGQRR